MTLCNSHANWKNAACLGNHPMARAIVTRMGLPARRFCAVEKFTDCGPWIRARLTIKFWTCDLRLNGFAGGDFHLPGS
jgi:hypothetical protein